MTQTQQAIQLRRALACLGLLAIVLFVGRVKTQVRMLNEPMEEAEEAVSGMVMRAAPMMEAAPMMAEKSSHRRMARRRSSGRPARAAAAAEPRVNTAAHTPTSVPDVTPPSERMLVKDGELAFWVPREQSSSAKQLAIDMCTQHGGYVERMDSHGGSRWAGRVPTPSSTLTLKLRVPVAKFEALSDALKTAMLGVGGGARLAHEEFSARDVTAEYVDIQGRHHALEIAHAQLSALMARAEKVSAVLAVMSELTENLQKKEGLEAQMKTFEKLAALSTLEITIQHDALRPTPPAPPPRPWAAALALRGAAKEWATLVDVASGVALHGLVFDLPVLALGLAIAGALLLCASRFAPCALSLLASALPCAPACADRLAARAAGSDDKHVLSRLLSEDAEAGPR